MTSPTYASEFTFTFEELPLIRERGIEAGLINGEATIRYWREDGETHCHIGEIYLESFKAGERGRHEVTMDYDKDLYLRIYGQLDDGRWCDAIRDRAEELLDEEREAA